MPVLAVQVRIELARVHLALTDLAGARALVQEIDEMLQRRPDLGTLVGEVLALRDRLGSERGSTSPGASALTAAELFVSRNTVNPQVLSIYRKLGASSRNSAVGRARELGPLEG